MNKPKKPKKPSQRDVAPTPRINTHKLLTRNIKTGEYCLIDADSHPQVFSDPETGLIVDQLYCETLEDMGYEWNFRVLRYSDYLKIVKDTNINVDFVITHIHNTDGYYAYSIVEYEMIDPKYHQKLDAYNNRFAIYEKQLEDYTVELEKYEQHRKSEQKRKLQEKLSKL